jgi:hypothetical protein
MTQHYLGVKRVLAWPAEKDGAPGYGVKYEDGYQSWSPKDIFERHYLPMGEANDGTKVTAEMVDAFVRGVEFEKRGEKTTVATMTLVNGFEMVDASSCVDPANYDHAVGCQIVTRRLTDRVWHLLGFLLATAGGVRQFPGTMHKA